MLLTLLQSNSTQGTFYLLKTIDKVHYVWFIRTVSWEGSYTYNWKWHEIRPQTLTIKQEDFDKGIIIKRYSTIEPFIEEFFEDVL